MMQKPNKPCYACGSNIWWQRPDGSWACGKCYPNPNPDSSPELLVTGEKYSPEVLALRDRVIAGNSKLNQAWRQLKEMDSKTEEWQKQFDRWHQANEQLSNLGRELKLKGYETCLYLNEKGEKIKKCLEPGDALGCRVCPSTRNYPAEELMALPGRRGSKAKQPEFVPGQTEFLGKLGGKE